MKLTPSELKRYSRQIILPEIGSPGQEKLKSAKVLIVGVGGLGCPALQYLSAAGVGTIGIIDNDTVDESNLQRQILYSQSDCAKLKVTCAKEKIEEINPFCKINDFACKLNAQNSVEIIKDYDIVIDGTDNFSSRYLTNDTCVVLGKPLVAASIFKFSGQISVYNYLHPDGRRSATYRCLFPEPPPTELAPSCAEIGVLGVLPGILGSLQASECLKIILGLGEVLADKLMTFDILKLQTQILNFTRQKNAENTVILDDAAYRLLDTCTGNKDPQHLISSSTLKNMLAKHQDIFLLDVRSSHEHAQDHIGGVCIPLDEITDKLEFIPKDKLVVAYCKSGQRSTKAARALLKIDGYQSILSLDGGLDLYNKSV